MHVWKHAFEGSRTHLQPQVIRLESQVSRYKQAAENAEKIEDELRLKNGNSKESFALHWTKQKSSR